MITTHNADEEASFSVGPDLKAWRTVTLTSGMLYVFANYALKEERSWVHQTSILWAPRDVLDFCRNIKSNKAAKIIDISLMEPFRRGKVDTWRWTKVRQIKVYDDKSVEIPVYFTDADDALGLTAEEAKQKMQVIYKARNMS